MLEPELIKICFIVHPQYQGWRLDHFIKARIPRLSRARIQKMIHAQASLGGTKYRPAQRVRAEQEIVLIRPAPKEPDVPRTFEVIFEDEHLLAICKPAGLPVHATARFHKNTLTEVLRERYPTGSIPVLAHRLDRETSGLMLLGKTNIIGTKLKALFRQRKIKKRYLAIVVGNAPDEGIIDTPIGPDLFSELRIKMAVTQTGAPSKTRFQTLARTNGFSLVRVTPETGRQHQIRVHMASIGYPIVGDKLYGEDPHYLLEFIETGWTPSLESRLLLPRHALHAAEMILPHPASLCELTLTSELPSDLQSFWQAL